MSGLNWIQFFQENKTDQPPQINQNKTKKQILFLTVIDSLTHSFI